MLSGWSIAEAGEDTRVPTASTTLSQELAVAGLDDQRGADLACGENQDLPGTASPNGEMRFDPEDRAAVPAAPMNVGLRLPEGWSWEHLVLTLVLSGAVAWWMLAFVRIIRFNRLMLEIDPAPTEWQSQTAELAARLGLRQVPALFLVPGRVPPMLWAIGSRPRLLVPSELWPATSLDQRTALLLHELAHLKRRDHWVRWLELIVGGLYWRLPGGSGGVAGYCARPKNSAAMRGSSGRCPKASRLTQLHFWQRLNSCRVPEPPRPLRRRPAATAMSHALKGGSK